MKPNLNKPPKTEQMICVVLYGLSKTRGRAEWTLMGPKPKDDQPEKTSA